MTDGGSFHEDKVAGHEADHSPLSSVKVKNACSYTSTLLYIFVGCLIKHTETLITVMDITVMLHEEAYHVLQAVLLIL
jgi:hypothetical protein